jgi:AraC-like DNA-binding protein
VWIPGGTDHSIHMHSAVMMKSIYARRGALPEMPDECLVTNVSPLLKELLIRACESPGLYPRRKRDASFLQVLAAEIQGSSRLPLTLSLPRDSRALSVARQLLDNPRAGDDMPELLRKAGVSRRTLERLYDNETGISFGRWRRQLALVHAVRLLGQGQKVSAVAEECGYNSVSAFVSMFRKRLGATPARYLTQGR